MAEEWYFAELGMELSGVTHHRSFCKSAEQEERCLFSWYTKHPIEWFMFTPSVLHVSRLMKKREWPMGAGEQEFSIMFWNCYEIA